MISRRTMLSSVAAGGATIFAANVTGLRAWAQTYVPVRRPLSDPAGADDVTAYGEFVTMMKGKEGDGSNVDWVTWSNIHGSFAGGFNLCPHSNWYFLPWHRSYVQMYEAGVRELTGKTDFAMPFWDWTNDPFPVQFTNDASVGGDSNPLFVPGRDMNSGMIPPNIAGQPVMDSIYAQTNYELFGSSRPAGQNNTDQSWVKARGAKAQLESRPHDNVHCIVAGPFMCAAPSPQDPIFFMHHGNIDHIWAVWSSMGRSNSNDPLWRDMTFESNWIRPDGTAYSSTVKDLFNTEDLGYTYDLPAPPSMMMMVDSGRDFLVASVFDREMSQMENLASGTGVSNITKADRAAKPGDPLSLSVSLAGQNITGAIDPNVAMSFETAGFAPKQVLAVLRGLEAASSDTTSLDVYVNLPDGAPSDSPYTNPHYVTTIGFFGQSANTDGGHDGAGFAAIVELTDVLQRLGAEDKLMSDAVTVQLVPVGLGGERVPGDVTVGSIEILVV